GAPDDALAVGVEEGAAVVAGRAGQAADVLAVGVHPVEIDVAVAYRREHDRAVLAAHRPLGVVAGRVGQLAQPAAVAAGAVDVVVGVQRPDVALTVIRPRRAGRAAPLGRREDHLAITGQEVRAGRGAAPV